MSNPSSAIAADEWRGAMGEKWLREIDRFEAMLVPAGAALLARAALRPGERVLDVGCGGGPTSFAVARAVGPGGAVVGIDVAPMLIDLADARAAKAGMAHVRFLCLDAGVDPIPGAPFDRIISRFGSMFFQKPVDAFQNLRTVLHSGGRLDLAVWAAPQDNPWLGALREIITRHIDLPPPDPYAPGPFSLADIAHLSDILDKSGFASPEIGVWEGEQPVGGVAASPAEAAGFAMRNMILGVNPDDHPPETLASLESDLTAEFSRHHVPGKGVMVRGKAWLVTTYRTG